MERKLDIFKNKSVRYPSNFYVYIESYGFHSCMGLGRCIAYDILEIEGGLGQK